METNLTKYKNDIDSLVKRGTILFDGLFYELRHELGDSYKKLPKERKEEIENCVFKGDYNGWYNESIALISQLIPDTAAAWKRRTVFRNWWE